MNESDRALFAKSDSKNARTKLQRLAMEQEETENVGSEAEGTDNHHKLGVANLCGV